MTAGRLINGYSRRDLVLAISYRWFLHPFLCPYTCPKSFQFVILMNVFAWRLYSFQTMKGRIAGLTPISEEICPGVENSDLSNLIASVSEATMLISLSLLWLMSLDFHLFCEPRRHSCDYLFCLSGPIDLSPCCSPHFLSLLALVIFSSSTRSTSTIVQIWKLSWRSWTLHLRRDKTHRTVRAVFPTKIMLSSISCLVSLVVISYSNCCVYAVPEKISSRVEAGIISLRESIGVANVLYSVVWPDFLCQTRGARDGDDDESAVTEISWGLTYDKHG